VYVTVFGLPAHPLLVHATVVIVPLAALLVLLAALWPASRRPLRWVPLATSVLAVVLVPLTTSTGEQLRDRLPQSEAIRRHAELADGLLPFVLALAVAAAGLAYAHGVVRLPWSARRPMEAPQPYPAAYPGGGSVAVAAPPTAVRAVPGTRRIGIAAAVLAVLAATGTVVQVVRIGDSGARATWTGVPSQPPPFERH
jgi:hypothetical protein